MPCARAPQSPAGYGAPSLTYVNGLPDMTTYQNALAELGLNNLIPVAYSVRDGPSCLPCCTARLKRG